MNLPILKEKLIFSVLSIKVCVFSVMSQTYAQLTSFWRENAMDSWGLTKYWIRDWWINLRQGMSDEHSIREWMLKSHENFRIVGLSWTPIPCLVPPCMPIMWKLTSQPARTCQITWWRQKVWLTQGSCCRFWSGSQRVLGISTSKIKLSFIKPCIYEMQLRYRLQNAIGGSGCWEK